MNPLIARLSQSVLLSMVFWAVVLGALTALVFGVKWILDLAIGGT